ncbi:MAG: PIN domain-containing protein [Candidatus Methanoperedens sp.]|nr:PIN domain-containing protein [Candidatus Methanoperedens sp.]MCZ7406448.1 PIN domain-containing protein [Candidatus Methanoperedens sp.]
MVTNIKNIVDYSPSERDKIFFDANIWLAIYGPSPQHWAQSPCSSLFHELIKNNIDIYINSLIISEVVNSWARLEFNQQRIKLNFKTNEFKKFRETPEFLNVAEDISINMEKILRWSKRFDSSLEYIDMEIINSNYRSGTYDFNDLIFREICKVNDFILVTNDRDFCATDVNILTANNYMLSMPRVSNNKCP